jgi:hypothetical protein
VDLDCAPAGAAIDAAAHVLAHVAVPSWGTALDRASSLFDAGYVEWARLELPSAVEEPAARDAALLGQLLARTQGGPELQWLLVLHRTARSLGAAGRLALDDLDASDVDDPAALAALHRLALRAPELVEVARCAVALAAPGYTEAWDRVLGATLKSAAADLRSALMPAIAVMPSLRRVSVRVSHPLGARGRGFPDVILVGAPGSWSGLATGAIAVRVAHEHAAHVATRAVEDAGVGSPEELWARAEPLALEAASRLLAGGPLAADHERLVASLDRSSLHADRSLLEAVVDRLGR